MIRVVLVKVCFLVFVLLLSALPGTASAACKPHHYRIDCQIFRDGSHLDYMLFLCVERTRFAEVRNTSTSVVTLDIRRRFKHFKRGNGSYYRDLGTVRKKLNPSERAETPRHGFKWGKIEAPNGDFGCEATWLEITCYANDKQGPVNCDQYISARAME